MSADFKHQHGRMVQIATAILNVARDPAPDAAAALTRERLRLSREVAQHCAGEVELLNARRPHSPTPAQTALIRKYHDDLLRWRHDLIACNSTWPPVRVMADRRAFSIEFGAIARRLRERVAWEEEEFYPAIFGREAA